jgi:hypothetical protein
MAELAPHIKFIREKGPPLRDIYWNSFAFTRADALALIQLLRQTDVVISGGDIFTVQEGVPTHDPAGWDFSKSGFSRDEQPQAGCSRAEAYIASSRALAA